MLDVPVAFSSHRLWDGCPFLAETTVMFSSPLCFRDLTKFPASISWWQFHWLKNSLLLVLLLLAFFGLRWVIQHRRRRRRLSSPRAILLLVGLIASLPLIYAVAAKGLVVFLPTDSGAAADAIVVLGRGEAEINRNRVDVAAELWRQGRAPMIFVSAGGEAVRIIQLLEERGIPNQVLDGENCSLTTEENALFTAAILHPQGIGRILLITDPPHMMRALLTFRAHGFTVIPYTSKLPYKWGFKAKAFLNLREYMGLVSYGLRGLFLPQRSLELNSPDVAKLLQKAEQYGQQRRL